MNTTETTFSEDSALRHLREEGVKALAEYFAELRGRLKDSVRGRIDHRLKGRLDDSDIVQETYVTAAGRLDEYLDDPRMPLFVWLRYLAQQNLTARSREHFNIQKRDVNREAVTGSGVLDDLADVLATSMISPHSQLAKAELAVEVRAVVNQLSEMDREILTMVHLEGLTLAEATAALDIEWETARKRLFRAMKRLKTLAEEMDDR